MGNCSSSNDTAAKKGPAKVLVLFYSTYGHGWLMAKAALAGAAEVAGVEAVLKRVPETLPEEVLAKMHAVDAQKAFASVPVADPNELGDYDAIVFVTPTRFGMMAGQMKSFVDATGGLWMQGKLVGKVGSVITGSASQHGGQEATILSFHTVLLHHGMIVAGLPGSWGKHSDISAVNGCSPYGASTISGGDGSRMPSELELDGAKFQGKHVATIAKKLTA